MREAINFFKTILKDTFFMGILVFIGVSIVSIIFFKSNPDIAKNIMEMFKKTVAEGIIKNGKISTTSLIFNNLRASLMLIVFGFVPFLFIPIFSLFSNAAIVGAAMFFGNSKITAHGILVFLCGIVPHGIFEIPALLIAFSIGYQICKNVSRKFMNKSYISIPFLVRGAVVTYIFMIIPLMIVAGIIEVNLTPVIMKMVM